MEENIRWNDMKKKKDRCMISPSIAGYTNILLLSTPYGFSFICTRKRYYHNPVQGLRGFYWLTSTYLFCHHFCTDLLSNPVLSAYHINYCTVMVHV